MAFVFTINGSTKTLQPGWKITETANGPNHFSGSIRSSDGTFRIAVDDVIVLTESGTTIFAGLVDDPQEQGWGSSSSSNGIGGQSGSAAIIQAFTALDYNSYAARIAVTTDTTRASESLAARLGWIAGLLSAQSVTLSGTQATGPTLPAATYSAGQYLIDVLNATMALANGTGSASWVWNIDYTLVLSAIQAGSVSAPTNITQGDTNTAGDITVEQARPSTYANYDIVLGGQGTQAVTDNFTGNGSTVTFALNYPLSTSYGYVTVGGVFETLGTGATWSYTSSTNSITRTSAPGVGVAISINYIAQFPVKVIADGGAPAAKRVTKTYTQPDVFDIVVLQALANAYVTRDIDSPRTVKVNLAWSLTGFHPGQVLTITSAKRNLSAVTCLITEVDITNIAGNVAQRQITAVTSSLLPATLRQQFQQTFGTSGGASAAGGVTIITSGGVGGSGTTGKIPKWLSPTTLGDSIVTDSGSGISVAGTLGWTGDTSGSGLVKAVNGGTHLDTSTSSGIPSLNAGAWTINNVLTANRVLLAGASNAIATSANLAFSSTTLTLNNTITTPASTQLLLSPTTDLITSPGSNNVLPPSSFLVNLGGFTAKYASIFASELRVESLVAQQTITTIGGRALIGSGANILAAAVSSGTTSFSFKYNDLTNGDVVLFEGPDNLGAYSTEFMQVASAPSGGGPYTYTMTRNYGGSTSAHAWPDGTACMNTGQTGAGFIDLYALNGLANGSAAGPSIVGNLRNSNTYNDWSARWKVGNLNGDYGFSTNVFGAAFGDHANTWISIDTTNGFRILHGSTVSLQLDTSGNASFVSGGCTINTSGVTLVPATSFSTLFPNTSAYAFTASSSRKLGMYGYEVSSVNYLKLEVQPAASGGILLAAVDDSPAGSASVSAGFQANSTGITYDSVTYALFTEMFTSILTPGSSANALTLIQAKHGAGGAGLGIIYLDGDQIRVINGNFFPAADNTLLCGAHAVAWKEVHSYSYVTEVSMASLKKDIQPTALGRDFLMGLKPVDYRYLDDAEDVPRRHGLLKHEVPETFGGHFGRGLEYLQFITPLIAGFQDHERRIAALEHR